MMKKWLKNKWTLTALGLVVGAVALAMVGPIMSNVETPDYKTLKKDGNIEVRQYAPTIVAEVTVTGLREDAIGDGVRLLADYIFGNNTKKNKIAMTAPVMQEPGQTRAEGEKIAMTAPVEQQKAGENTWRVTFTMPSEYTMEILPKPNNHKVRLRKVPAKTYAAIRFSGRNTNKNLRQHARELEQYLEANNLTPKGPPLYAFYNPPWTLPFLRRNEVMVEIHT